MSNDPIEQLSSLIHDEKKQMEETNEENQKVIIKGSLIVDKNVETDSESEEEEEEEKDDFNESNGMGKQTLNLKSDVQMVKLTDNDEDEIEVLTEGNVKRKEPLIKNKPNLMDAMEKAIEENEINKEIEGNHQIEISNLSENSTWLNRSIINENKTKNDIIHKEDIESFGITYHSKNQNENNIKLPSGPSFIDEKQFEQEIEDPSSIANKSIEYSIRQDDEFENILLSQPSELILDINKDNNNENNERLEDKDNTQDLDYNSLNLKIEEQKRNDKLKEREILEKIKLEKEEEKEKNEILLNTDKNILVNVTSSDNVKPKENSNPLKEIHQLYKSGLGDHEIILLEEKKNNKEVNDKNKNNVNLNNLSISNGIKEYKESDLLNKQNTKNISTIKEEDEIDEEEKDKENEEYKIKLKNDQLNELKKIENEWNQLDNLKEIDDTTYINNDINNNNLNNNNRQKLTTIINFNDAFMYFTESKYVIDDHIDTIIFEEINIGTSCGPLTGFLRYNKPKLSFPNAKKERDLIFCIAKCQLETEKYDIHNQILQTLYKKFTNTSFDCPRFGSHWEILGFQGNDPATDLRGSGMLGLLQLLHLITNDNDLAIKLYRQANDKKNHFPLFVTCFNLSVATISALRTGKLYSECNENKSIIKSMNKLYSAMCWKLHNNWKKNEAKEQFPIILRSIVEEAKKNPIKLIRNSEKTKNIKDPVRQEKMTNEEIMLFSSLDEEKSLKEDKISIMAKHHGHLVK